MKSKIFASLKIVLPLLLGLYLVWFFYSSLSPQDKIEIVAAFKAANYFWILLSLVFAGISHASRAYRWKFTLEPLNIKPDFWNSFFSVMIAYLVNMAVPRLGEVSRVGMMAKYEKQPFNKLLGTVIAERVADFIILMMFTAVVIYLQYETIQQLLDQILQNLGAKIPATGLILVVFLIGVLSLLGLLILLRTQKANPFVNKLRNGLMGLYEGVKSIFKMRAVGAFLFHTVLIWAMYLLMFYLCFFSLPSTANVPFEGILTAFVLGGFTIVATNGGIGAYPLAIQAVLLLYEVDKNTGGAFGWIVWTAQTVFLVLAGALAFLIMPYYNKRKANVQVVQ